MTTPNKPNTVAKPMPDHELRASADLPRMLRELNCPWTAILAQRLLDEITRLRARETELLRQLAQWNDWDDDPIGPSPAGHIGH